MYISIDLCHPIIQLKAASEEAQPTKSQMAPVTTNFPAVLLGALATCLVILAANVDENRPYEFAFSIEDFQHRHEKKDSTGIITGNYGFITADGVYHETAYATDKNGHFRITKMKNRKITSLEIAREIFKGKPEVAKRVIQVLANSCSGCGIPVTKKISTKQYEPNGIGARENHELRHPSYPIADGNNSPIKSVPNEIHRYSETANFKKSTTNQAGDSDILRVANGNTENTSNDLNYHFNYTITSHGHEESGYRNGKKDGSYRTVGINETSVNVDYLSNEFGHQPNITFMKQKADSNAEEILKEFVFQWFFKRR